MTWNRFYWERISAISKTFTNWRFWHKLVARNGWTFHSIIYRRQPIFRKRDEGAEPGNNRRPFYGSSQTSKALYTISSRCFIFDIVNSIFRFDCPQVQWADACLVVYAITDRKSFLHASETLAALHKVRQGAGPLALLANKADLEHLREVSMKIRFDLKIYRVTPVLVVEHLWEKWKN